jgi:hypothetical protein
VVPGLISKHWHTRVSFLEALKKIENSWYEMDGILAFLKKRLTMKILCKRKSKKPWQLLL